MSASAHPYPVQVEGQLDPSLSRGLWLVKWLLVIPHVLALVALWLAFFVISVAAFFAILFTGRYPRGLFDFNVGVLRWTWRVGFYAFNANGTDRYPPFTLQDVEYPARLTVDYPESLSRGLVLVKWWLLAIPQYLVVAVFIGGLWYGTHWGGAIALLVFIAVVALLFTGRYPQGLFDLVLGMNRWALRVTAYACLMTDTYPPFRLDMGATEPGIAIPAAAPRTAVRGTSPVGGVIMTVLGALGVLVGLALIIAGSGVLWVDQTQRDSRGFVMSPTERLTTQTPAITAAYQRTNDALHARSLAFDTHGPSWLFTSDRLGTLRIHAHTANGRQLFVGIAPTAKAEDYLAGVSHAELNGFPNGNPRYVDQPGRASAPRPAAQTFWAAKATGNNVALSWHVRHGDWTIAVMNANGAPGVSTDAQLGARLAFLGELAGILLGIGLVSAAAAAALMVFGIRRLNRPTAISTAGNDG
ncbi:MAG TPA: DUF4389 domain-containing protein [Gaiellales bacterium]|nr:DUF4389 domain-containing protein [Gaiellales bacterium]